MERNKRKMGRLLGILAAVLVPAIATAALTIPNTFTAGTVIKSADVNANFAAVATAVTADQTAVAALQTTLASLQTTVASLQTTVTSLQSTVAAMPQIVGFAHIYQDYYYTTGIAAFGGSGTTNVTVIGGFPTTVTFTGKFPSSINTAKVHILATPEVGDYTALDTVVTNATPTSITIAVYTWMSNLASTAGEQVGGPFFVALLVSP